jgi:hypothetical protein
LGQQLQATLLQQLPTQQVLTVAQQYLYSQLPHHLAGLQEQAHHQLQLAD